VARQPWTAPPVVAALALTLLAVLPARHGGGRAFEFAFGGPVGGLIERGDGAAPFVTNATGVATGLNADRVDGREGTDLLGRTEKAADSDLLDGLDSTAFLRTNQQAADSAQLQGKSAADLVMRGRFAADGTLQAGFGSSTGDRARAPGPVSRSRRPR
jgi:hypothetical protein